ncbi:hypothetical protein BC828DRAFT_403526 [Blastocladiella britannica]|nr:hypothetical protein BC828DRAFT_403526 [Blastocladiella britannica]
MIPILVISKILAIAVHSSASLLDADHLLLVVPYAAAPPVLDAVLSVHGTALVFAATNDLGILSHQALRIVVVENIDQVMDVAVALGGGDGDGMRLETVQWAMVQAMPRSVRPMVQAAAMHQISSAMDWNIVNPHLCRQQAINVARTLACRASEHGHLRPLTWWWSIFGRGTVAQMSDGSVLVAAATGTETTSDHTAVAAMEWWLDTVPEIWTRDNTAAAMHAASSAGRSIARQWIRDQVRAGRFSFAVADEPVVEQLEDEFRACVTRGHLVDLDRADMLDWWWTHLPPTFIAAQSDTIRSMVMIACQYGSVRVLEWLWHHSVQGGHRATTELPESTARDWINMPRIEIDWCTHFSALQWAVAKGHMNPVPPGTHLQTLYMNATAAVDNPAAVSAWWRTQVDGAVLPPAPIEWSIVAACRCGRVDLLAQCYTNGGPIPSDAILDASAVGHLSILAWLWTREKNVLLTHATGAIDAAARNGQLAAVQWWHARCMESHHPFRLSAATLRRITQRRDSAAILEWWYCSLVDHDDADSTNNPDWVTAKTIRTCLGVAMAGACVPAVNIWATLAAANAVVLSESDIPLYGPATTVDRMVSIMASVQQSFGVTVQSTADALTTTPIVECCSFTRRLAAVPALAARLDDETSSVYACHEIYHSI